MVWQDILISIGQWLFVFALLPSIFGKDKPAITTSILTATILFAFTICYWTLGLKISAISTVIVAIEWSILAYQKYKQKIPE